MSMTSSGYRSYDKTVNQLPKFSFANKEIIYLLIDYVVEKRLSSSPQKVALGCERFNYHRDEGQAH